MLNSDILTVVQKVVAQEAVVQEAVVQEEVVQEEVVQEDDTTVVHFTSLYSML